MGEAIFQYGRRHEPREDAPKGWETWCCIRCGHEFHAPPGETLYPCSKVETRRLPYDTDVGLGPCGGTHMRIR